MSRMIFPNLPVQDLASSVEFWSALGFEFNQEFGSSECACLVINDQASVMLLAADFFHGFHKTTPHTGTEILLCLSAESREEVDELCERAAAAGATDAEERVDQGPMYGGSFRDIDGHIWEVLWMSTN
ncbi:MAG: VOC family protein [Nocardioides sp.]|nr:VOC family protein [Nocardioides sp.]